MRIGDWIFDTRNGDIFKIEQIWGEWLLHDDWIDAGDVSFVEDCRRATKEEIKRGKSKRKMPQRKGA
ncbi:hypothetical protein CVD28_00415 [Bacillus sp. M6-12]|uniref:hypothetical protein n=1 Tax=Bacillus sp. M6-12 TaxID=2054166 RepID=UPI000C791F4C|nr:hypothetical protein [Bacillus sp. M6-12]PLS18898.1 hypothetical protein CVD28_00415 [Bacillus sp. M6-12]